MRCLAHMRRAPDEAMQGYAQRTAARIQDWFDGLELQRCYEAALRRLHRWMGKGLLQPGLGGGSSQVAHVLRYRSRQWCTRVEVDERLRLDTRSADADGFRHASTGRQSAAEDPFVICKGESWRDLVTCPVAWAHLETDFVIALHRAAGFKVPRKLLKAAAAGGAASSWGQTGGKGAEGAPSRGGVRRRGGRPRRRGGWS